MGKFRRIDKIYKTARQLEQLDGIKRHVDHIIPLKAVNELGKYIACGLHVETNLQILFAKDNISKKIKWVKKNKRRRIRYSLVLLEIIS